MRAIADELVECEPRFSASCGDAVTVAMGAMRRLGLAAWSRLGDRRASCLDYLRDHRLPIDDCGSEGRYDLIVTGSDLAMPSNVRNARVVLVQDGILDPPTLLSHLCKRLPILPLWVGGTALTGQSGLFERFCVASEGYREFFVGEGVDSSKLSVTGIPNFDDCRKYLVNDFPYRGFVLVCTSDARKTFRRGDRAALVRRALEAAAGRQVIFKLHANEANENNARADAELRALAPDALVVSTGSAEEMIANAGVVYPEGSSAAVVALALGKEVHANFPLDALRRLLPVQNGGRAAKNVARVCRDVLNSSKPRPFEPLVTPLHAVVGAVCA